MSNLDKYIPGCPVEVKSILRLLHMLGFEQTSSAMDKYEYEGDRVFVGGDSKYTYLHFDGPTYLYEGHTTHASIMLDLDYDDEGEVAACIVRRWAGDFDIEDSGEYVPLMEEPEYRPFFAYLNREMDRRPRSGELGVAQPDEFLEMPDNDYMGLPNEIRAVFRLLRMLDFTCSSAGKESVNGPITSWMLDGIPYLLGEKETYATVGIALCQDHEGVISAEVYRYFGDWKHIEAEEFGPVVDGLCEGPEPFYAYLRTGFGSVLRNVTRPDDQLPVFE